MTDKPTILDELTGQKVTALHEDFLNTLGWPHQVQDTRVDALWAAVEANHRNNALLWEQEDLARRRLAPDSEIAQNKRAIDRHNQLRNDAIERMDEYILNRLPSVTQSSTPPSSTTQRSAGTSSSARLNSETAGSMIDRLSILSLKIRAMRAQTLRTDVDVEHIETCKNKLARLLEQRDDLSHCLDTLLQDAMNGKAFYKAYRQFKMYNDPKLNPQIYGERSSDQTR
jgi:hypothetical protein